MGRWTNRARTLQSRSLAEFFEGLDERELDHVRRYVRQVERQSFRHAALILNRSSNGILYLIVAAITIGVFGRPILSAVLVSGITVLAAHLIYPLIKSHCARRRPFDCDPTIASMLAPLDRHSFPSGHAMTATAAFLPLSAAIPVLTGPALVMIVLIGWARIAAGHHYPSDVLAGALLGSAMASPGIVWLLQ